MKRIFLLTVLACVCAYSQDARKGRDTSFTLSAATQQVIQEYPFAKAVIPIISNKVTVHKNIVYSRYSGRELYMDIVSPKDMWSEKRAVVLLLHGGGWRSGDRSMELPMALKIAEAGFICCCVEYRLSPEARFPAAVYDIKTAIRFCRSNAAQFNIDTTRIILYGTSAGGQLAALVGISQAGGHFTEQGEYRDHSNEVQGIIDIDGVLDMTDPAESGKDTLPGQPSVGKLWLGATFSENPSIWRRASAINYVTRKSPPMLFINSSHPRFHAGRDSVINMLKKYGIYSEVHTIANTPHPFWLFHPWFDEAIKHIQVFLSRFRK